MADLKKMSITELDLFIQDCGNRRDEIRAKQLAAVKVRDQKTIDEEISRKLGKPVKVVDAD